MVRLLSLVPRHNPLRKTPMLLCNTSRSRNMGLLVLVVCTSLSCAHTMPAPPLNTARPIVQTGASVLRTPALHVSADELHTYDFQQLIQTMVNTMRQAPGVGLAAPQIGIAKQVFVMEDRAELQAALQPHELLERQRQPLPLTVIVNPQLELLGDKTATFFEGCLSVSGYGALVKRHLRVRLTGLDAQGRPLDLVLSGWPARIAQHEFDHLQGILYIDRMHSRSFSTQAQWKARFGGKHAHDINTHWSTPPETQRD